MNDDRHIILKQRWFDLPAILLLLVVLSIAFTRLTATSWTQNLGVTRTITYLGLISGIALGVSRFSPRLVGFFASIYGIFVVAWRVGEIAGEGIQWQERLLSIAGRLGVILNHLFQQKPVPDNLLFVILMGMLFWILSVHSGYTLARFAHPWMTVLPAGLAVIVIHHYEVIEPSVESVLPSRAWYLFAYLLFGLLLAVRLIYLHKRKIWEQQNTYLPPYLSIDFGRFALVTLLIVLVLSWTAPVLAGNLPGATHTYQDFSERFRSVRNMLSNLTASLRASAGIVSDYYGPSLALGRGTPLSDNVLFTVQIPENAPLGTRYYWRARVYNQYENGWTSTLDTTRALAAENIALEFPDIQDNNPGAFSFAFTLAAPVSTLYTVAQPVWISRPTQAEMGLNPDGTVDLTTIRAVPSLRAGETYNLRASMNQVTVRRLRQSHMDYPDWVKERYLQLPPTITARTHELARQIAAGKDNPYDIVAAVTEYLRANIEYTEIVPALPGGAEPVDWFLFDLKQGFCNYYASAQVVLLRSLGIPARIAVGYAQGEPLEVQPAFTVRYKDAHAWPEVYFTGIGWVEFEPTAAQPQIIRPLGDSQITPENQALDENLPTPDQNPLDRLDREEEGPEAGGLTDNNITTIAIIISVVILTTILLGLVLSSLLRRPAIQKRIAALPMQLEKTIRRLGLRPPSFLSDWAQRSRLTPLERAYLELSLALRRLGKSPHVTDTPTERLNHLVEVLPPSQQPAQVLVKEYQAETFQRDVRANLLAAQLASNEIRSLSWKALVRQLFVESTTRNGQEKRNKSR